MEARPGQQQRFSRDTAAPRLVEARLEGSSTATEAETSQLLTRLERQAAESGRLEGRVQILERSLKVERDARRRLVDRLKQERAAAEVLHQRAERAETAHAAATAQLDRINAAVTRAEQQTQLTWAQLAAAERELAWTARPFWRKLLRRPPSES